MSEPLGLIAGLGDIPAILAREAELAGRRVVAVAFDKVSISALESAASETSLLGLGQASKIMRTFHDAGVKDIAMIGKVDKRFLLRNPKIDLRGISILKNLVSGSDDTIMLGIVRELEKEGFRVVSQVEFLRNLMPGAGVFSSRQPAKAELADIKFGMKMAKGIAALDIGQTVVVKNMSILAVEAIEGTDEAIERGAGFAGSGAVVCKVSKPNQDLRFDVPTVGVKTIEHMVKVKASLLAIEANGTVVVNLNEMVELCNKRKLAFVAV